MTTKPNDYAISTSLLGRLEELVDHEYAKRGQMSRNQKMLARLTRYHMELDDIARDIEHLLLANIGGKWNEEQLKKEEQS